MFPKIYEREPAAKNLNCGLWNAKCQQPQTFFFLFGGGGVRPKQFFCWLPLESSGLLPETTAVGEFAAIIFDSISEVEKREDRSFNHQPRA